MSQSSPPPIPAALNPKTRDVEFDLDHTLAAVISLRTRIPEDAFTARVLGTERSGHGVVFQERGLVLTIGYLVAEAEEVWLLDGKGHAVEGDVLAYDYETGFGLVRALRPFAPPALQPGSCLALSRGSPVVLAGAGGKRNAIRTEVQSVGPFAGYWEYLIDSAIFTAPAHPDWGGAALLDGAGRLCGIGSLFLDSVPGPGVPGEGNMSVATDLLLPIQDELLRHGSTLKPARPWLGVFIAETEAGLGVGGLYPGGPAASALQEGDMLVALGGVPVQDLAGLYRLLWASGEAGVTVALTVQREGKLLEVKLRSMDRRQAWRKPSLH